MKPTSKKVFQKAKTNNFPNSLNFSVKLILFFKNYEKTTQNVLLLLVFKHYVYKNLYNLN